jgi:hypothetical protein
MYTNDCGCFDNTIPLHLAPVVEFTPGLPEPQELAPAWWAEAVRWTRRGFVYSPYTSRQDTYPTKELFGTWERIKVAL